MIVGVGLFFVVLGIPVALACSSVLLAWGSARHAHLRSRFLLWGAASAAFGLMVMAVIARATHEDKHYDDFGSALQTLAAINGGALLLAGLGPLTPWLLGVLRRRTARLSPAIRLAARDVARNSPRTAPPIAITMVMTAIAIAWMIVSVAEAAQTRAGYFPQARSGALVVDVRSDDPAVSRAAVQQELPGVPIAQRDAPNHRGHFSMEVKDLPDTESIDPEGFIGDRALLRYLTGDPDTPYDEGKAVVVTPNDIQVDTVTIFYADDDQAKELSSKSIPAIAVESADPYVNELFIPTKVIRDLGLRPEPIELIVDPSAHRTTEAEQERINQRLGGDLNTYVERAFQESAEWMGEVAAAIVVAIASALVAGGQAGAGGRTRRVLLRVGAGSPLALRMFAAGRAGWSMLCGTALGTFAGCVVGLFLAWPMTASIDWDVLPRVPFETPWWAIAALATGLPVLAGVIAALPRPRRP